MIKITAKLTVNDYPTKYSADPALRLRQASFEGDINTAQTTLALYPEVINATGKETGNSALHQACLHDKQELVIFLLEHGAEITLSNKDGKTPLELLVYKPTQAQSYDQLKLCLNDKLCQAINHHDVRVMTTLLLNSQIPFDLSTNSSLAQQAFCLAIKNNNIAAVHTLINAGAKVDLDNLALRETLQTAASTTAQPIILLLNLANEVHKFNDLLQPLLGNAEANNESFRYHYNNLNQMSDEGLAEFTKLCGKSPKKFIEQGLAIKEDSAAKKLENVKALQYILSAYLHGCLLNKIVKYFMSNKVILKSCGSLSYLAMAYLLNSTYMKNNSHIQCEILAIYPTSNRSLGHEFLAINRQGKQDIPSVNQINTWGEHTLIFDPLQNRLFVLNQNMLKAEPKTIIEKYQQSPELISILDKQPLYKNYTVAVSQCRFIPVDLATVELVKQKVEFAEDLYNQAQNFQEQIASNMDQFKIGDYKIVQA